DKTDAAKSGFDDDFIYKEMELPLQARKIPFTQMSREEALVIFKEWGELEGKTEY
ncbi:MAG: tRNA-specific adenosine deaminase, partial [Flavobacteriales bacterium]|nr:tRNA-specific adenosine deaminase [Flavobacteriales bacterium]